MVTITEEMVLDPSNPEHVQMIREYEQKTGKKVISDVSPHLSPTLETTTPPAPEPDGEQVFVDIRKVARLAAATKKNYDNIKN